MAFGIIRNLGSAIKDIVEKYLYNNGNEYSAITNGWTKTFTYNSYSSVGGTKYSTYFKCNASGTGAVSGYCTDNPIDLTDYNKIIVDWETTSVYASRGLSLQIYNSKAFPSASTVKSDTATGRSQIEVDISSYSGNYYIMICGYINISGQTRGGNVYSVKLVKE